MLQLTIFLQSLVTPKTQIQLAEGPILLANKLNEKKEHKMRKC